MESSCSIKAVISWQECEESGQHYRGVQSAIDGDIGINNNKTWRCTECVSVYKVAKRTLTENHMMN